MNKRTAILAGTVVMALTLAGCGGSDFAASETTAATSEPTTTTTAAATTTTVAETTTTTAAPTTVDVGDPANWPLEPPALDLPVTFTDGAGNEVTVTSVDRIGSVYGSASEILWTLGLGDNIVVIEGTTQYPAELAALPSVGFFRSLPVEGILAQEPDVLFASSDAGPPETMEALAAAGVVVVIVPDTTPEPDSLTALIETIGEAVGAGETAEPLAAALRSAYDGVASEPAADAPVVAYAVARGQNVFMTGLDSPSNTFIAAAGYTSAAQVLGLDNAAPLTPEAMVVANPAVIITTRTSVEQAGGEEAFMALPGVAESDAGINGALIVWEDDSAIQQWTPRSAATVQQLKALLEGLTG